MLHTRPKVSANWYAADNLSLAAFSGRPHTITVEPDIQDMRAWLNDPLVTPGDRMLVGFLELRAIQVGSFAQDPHTKLLRVARCARALKVKYAALPR